MRSGGVIWVNVNGILAFNWHWTEGGGWGMEAMPNWYHADKNLFISLLGLCVINFTSGYHDFVN